jgi:hypothetical protein
LTSRGAVAGLGEHQAAVARNGEEEGGSWSFACLTGVSARTPPHGKGWSWGYSRGATPAAYARHADARGVAGLQGALRRERQSDERHAASHTGCAASKSSRAGHPATRYERPAGSKPDTSPTRTAPLPLRLPPAKAANSSRLLTAATSTSSNYDTIAVLQVHGVHRRHDWRSHGRRRDSGIRVVPRPARFHMTEPPARAAVGSTRNRRKRYPETVPSPRTSR